MALAIIYSRCHETVATILYHPCSKSTLSKKIISNPAASQLNNKKFSFPQFFFHFPSEKPLLSNISANICKNLKMPKLDTQGLRGN
jgi:hypothetical protein